MVDFQVNYEAGKRLRWGETLYRVDDGHYMFKYLPSSAYLYLPLSYFPLPLAKTFWYALIVVCSVSVFILSFRLFPSGKKRPLMIFLFPPLILAKYFFREIDLGQINAFVTVILLFMVWLLASPGNKTSLQKEGAAGFLWGLSMALKPYTVIFFPYFIIKKKWRILAGGFFVLGLALLSPILYYGWKGNLLVLIEWASTLSQSTPHLFTSWDNISIIGFFSKWTGNQSISSVLAAGVIGILAVWFLVLIHQGRKIHRNTVMECAFLLGCIPLVSPLGWDYNLLMAALAIVILIIRWNAFSSPWKILLALNFAVIGLSFYDLMGKSLYAKFMNWSILTLNFLLVLGYLSFLRLKKFC